MSPSEAARLTDPELLSLMLHASSAGQRAEIDDQWNAVVAAAEDLERQRALAEQRDRERREEEAARAREEMAQMEEAEAQAKLKAERQAREEEEAARAARERAELEIVAEARARAEAEAAPVRAAEATRVMLADMLAAHTEAMRALVADERGSREALEQSLMGALGSVAEALTQLQQQQRGEPLPMAAYRDAAVRGVTAAHEAEAVADSRVYSPAPAAAFPPPADAQGMYAPHTHPQLLRSPGTQASLDLSCLGSPSTGRSLDSSASSASDGSVRDAYYHYLRRYLRSPRGMLLDPDMSEGEVYTDYRGRQRVHDSHPNAQLDLSEGEVFVGPDGVPRVAGPAMYSRSPLPSDASLSTEGSSDGFAHLRRAQPQPRSGGRLHSVSSTSSTLSPVSTSSSSHSHSFGSVLSPIASTAPRTPPSLQSPSAATRARNTRHRARVQPGALHGYVSPATPRSEGEVSGRLSLTDMEQSLRGALALSLDSSDGRSWSPRTIGTNGTDDTDDTTALLGRLGYRLENGFPDASQTLLSVDADTEADSMADSLVGRMRPALGSPGMLSAASEMLSEGEVSGLVRRF
jgi:chemotaxis protein histidine kinase CheA